MKAAQYKNRVLWLVLLVGILSALAVYRIGFHRPVPGFNEEAMKSLQGQTQESQTKSGTSESPSVDPPQSVLQPSHPVEPGMELPTQGRYRSQHPYYFRVVFGEQGTKSMLGVLDESGGTGAGYDVAYMDENMNGDLKDEAAKRFTKNERGSRAGQFEPRFEFMGPFKGDEKAKYTLDIYSFAKNRGNMPENEYYFFWFLDIRDWNYFFINGRMTLFSSAADALKGTPVRLGGPCKWEINSQTRDGKQLVSAGLKDENGCTLRIVRKAGQTISPTLTVMQDGKVKAEEKMQFG
jgi:hypothetical protein